jgi:hypothetical protein
LKETLITYYHISLSNRRKEKRTFSLLREEAEEVLKTADFDLIGISPDEKVGEGKFRNHRREPSEELITEGFVFEG